MLLCWDGVLLTLNVVGEENFALNEYIYVNNGKAAGGDPDMDDQQFWVARVLEIRAVDEAHVYLRVYWLYWPEELPGGRQPYHGQKELIASNHMDIIDAMTVSGRAHVKHWMELDEDEELPELYWRQKFDYPSRTLMEVREHCKCHRYYNPDKLMYGCPHCKTWLHEECVQEEIKRNSYAKLLKEPGEETLRAQLAGIDLDSSEVKATPKKGKKPVATANGKGKGNDFKNPTIEMLDKIFDVFITVNSDGTATKALIRDIRPAEGEEAAEGEEEVEEEEEDGEGSEDDEEVKKEKRKKKKARREWVEDVMCLVCGKTIH
ncbi:hypothetical protein L211DRAFT_612925 [Terfezia boudieri ATCC MYA-4762]|uniref:BAH domain-containing protein n=1 Tax=Terfezia boudieri ATCC MYA-4762 TaxID=1051890 RepID=A0A3N4M1B7_9PEZI|nr:hypothetical protein L211DRAFT_612925 [Terfezia boudieri ATCC MYA-4762]